MINYFLLKLENNFDNVTYYIEMNKSYDYNSKTKVYVSIISNNTEKIIPLKQNFGYYIYTIRKEEINNYLNPIDSRKIKLIFECIKGGEGKSYFPWMFDIILYTDKIKFNKYLFKDYAFIRKNEIHKLNLNIVSFFVKKLSGDIYLSME